MMAVKAFIPILANSHFNLNFQISCVRTISKPLNLATKQLVKGKRPSTEQDMPKPTSDYYIRDMTQEDIPKIMEIRKKLKIHDCYSCLQTWNKIHPQGIFLAENKRGQIVATAAFVHNSDEVCIGGLVYVDPEYRNIGLGRKVLELGVGEVSQGRISFAEMQSRI
ncbi:uncharacterized protein [Parasteatoda tepidariorum]|uniref:uncharacterized protein isoform X3 n=1 Tax=Parasteatoda tepidariorum TaxID=114398 RepID=UPI0039BCD3CD